jgi:transcriptional regulator with XRE-family HTH domain
MSQALKALNPFASANSFIGARIRAHRLAFGLSQSALGTRTLSSGSAIHMIETGDRPLHADHASQLDDEFGTHGELAALVEARDRGLLWFQEERDMDATRRAFLHGLAGLPVIAAADHIGRGMQAMFTGGLPSTGVDAWQDTTARYANRYTVTAPDQLLTEMVPDLAAIHRLTAAHPHQRDLSAVAARLSGLTSALLTDLGEVAKARHWLTVLNGYAEAAGDTRIRIWGQGALAVLDTYYATPDQVIADTDQAIPGTADFACAGTIMLYGLRARALATHGDAEGATLALDTAARLHAGLTVEEADDYMWGFPERQLRWYESRTFTLTGDMRRADESRDEALRLYPADDQVDRVLLQLDGAACALTAGEPDRAAAIATAALAAVPRQRRTSVVERRADELGVGLTSHVDLTAVRDYNEFRAGWRTV